jgi:phosphoglycolate phosphatase
MLPVPPRLLVFDLDGTLIDSSLDLCHSVNAALEHVGRPRLPDHLIASYIGDGAAMLVRRALGSSADTDTGLRVDDLSEPPAGAQPLFDLTYQFFLEYYRAHKLDNTRCYPGVLDALAAMRSRHPHLPMAVLTNKPVHPSRDICAALGLSPFFFQNYGGNSFPTKKPEPTGLRQLIAEASVLLGQEIDAADTVMIGDTDVDVLTARACGAGALGCSFGLAPERLAAVKPDAIVDSPSEWPTVLGL